jgi:hypothetical protein
MTPSLSEIQTKLARAKGHRDSLLGRLQAVQREVVSLREEELLLDHVEVLFRQLLNAEITEAKLAVEDLTTEALHAVFTDQDLSVRADVEVERGKVAISLVTVQKDALGNITEGCSNESFGGAVTTVESVLLRLLVLLRRGLRPVLVLDEALPAFDANYAGNMGQFLLAVCTRMHVDLLLVTHNPLLFETAHKAYRVSRQDDCAHFTQVN